MAAIILHAKCKNRVRTSVVCQRPKTDKHEKLDDHAYAGDVEGIRGGVDQLGAEVVHAMVFGLCLHKHPQANER